MSKAFFRIGRDDLLGCCILGNESPTSEGRTQWMQCFANVYGNNLPNEPAYNVDNNLSNNRQTDNDKNSINAPVFTMFANSNLIGNCESFDIVHQMDLKEVHGKFSVASISSNGNPLGIYSYENNLRHVGQWHSILGEVPDTFKNIPKMKRKEFLK